MINYPISKDWDCKYTLEELIEIHSNNPIYRRLGLEGKDDKTCFLVANYRKHKSDDCYGGFILLFEVEKDKYVQIGIKEDGFVYIGDQMYFDEKNTKLFNAEEAIDFMIKYRNFLESTSDFERKLIKIFDESCINIIYDYNYSPQYKYSKDLTYLVDKYKK